MNPKSEIRLFAKERILELQDRPEKDRAIMKLLQKILQKGEKVLAYRADKWEVNLDTLVLENSDIEFYFPRVLSMSSRILEFIKPDSWHKGGLGVWEPSGDRKISPTEADWAIVPALGFNSEGKRLGRGGGFYDRALAEIPASRLLGVQYSEMFPLDFLALPHDLRIGQILSDNGVIFSI